MRDVDTIRNTSTLIDRAIISDLANQKLTSHPIINDSKFLRRTYLGIVGRIPTYSESQDFLNNTDDNKRSDLIDKLVSSPGYESKIFNFWADMLRLKSTDQQYGLGWHLWLRDSVSSNKPYDKMVYEMLSARGHTVQNPAVGYYLRDRNMLLDNISNSSKVFLGTQIGCAQCHDDPFEDRTQKEYYELAAFGANIDYKSTSAFQKINNTATTLAHQHGIKKSTTLPHQAKNKKEKQAIKDQNKKFDRFIQQTRKDMYSVYKNFDRNEISYNDKKNLKLPNDYQYNDGSPGDIVKPNPLFGSIEHKIQQKSDKLEKFGQWMTNPENPQFTKNIANRLWKHVYGYGLAEPVDNWTDSTKVAHPEALTLVEKILRTNQYNIRETLRILYHTKLFQQAVSKEEVPPGSIYAFQGPVLRRLSAEELYDSYLTLEKGNADSNRNIKLTVNIEPQALIKLDKIADKNEEAIKALQVKNRALQLDRNKAQEVGDLKKIKHINDQRNAIYREINELKKSNAIELTKKIPAATSVAQMSTMGNLHNLKNQGPLRASELPSPRRGDAFLRIFGSSDRQTSNAAHTDSSIPQTLTLLNGHQIQQLANKNKGEVMNLIRSAKTAEEKLNILFIGIYSRYPTTEEHIKFQPFTNDKKQISVLAKAMLNSKNFLFLQ